MEKLEKRYNVVLKTLKTLKKSLDTLENLASDEEKFYKGLRDSVIQRFEYSIDNFWKFLKIYLQEKHQVVTSGSPRTILRDSLNANIITDEEFEELVECLRDRNLTSHTYNEPLAAEIASKVTDYYELMEKIIAKIEI